MTTDRVEYVLDLGEEFWGLHAPEESVELDDSYIGGVATIIVSADLDTGEITSPYVDWYEACDHRGLRSIFTGLVTAHPDRMHRFLVVPVDECTLTELMDELDSGLRESLYHTEPAYLEYSPVDTGDYVSTAGEMDEE